MNFTKILFPFSVLMCHQVINSNLTSLNQRFLIRRGCILIQHCYKCDRKPAKSSGIVRTGILWDSDNDALAPKLSLTPERPSDYCFVDCTAICFGFRSILCLYIYIKRICRKVCVKNFFTSAENDDRSGVRYPTDVKSIRHLFRS